MNAPPDPPLIPPFDFVQAWNAAHWNLGPYRTGLDPLVMLAWHQATEWNRQPFRMLLTVI